MHIVKGQSIIYYSDRLGKLGTYTFLVNFSNYLLLADNNKHISLFTFVFLGKTSYGRGYGLSIYMVNFWGHPFKYILIFLKLLPIS